jgi:hypothetical protein
MGLFLLCFAGKKPKMLLRSALQLIPAMLIQPRNLFQQEAGRIVRASNHHGGSTVISTVTRIVIRMSAPSLLKALF